MKNLLFYLCFGLVLQASLFSQESDSLLSVYLERANSHIALERYASAHFTLDSALQRAAFRPELVCLMVDNVFQNYFQQEDLTLFYLKNTQREEGRNLTVIRHPDRMLQKLIKAYPESGYAYKLLGDFQRLSLREGIKNPLGNPEPTWVVRDRIYAYYSRAGQLGFRDTGMNRWMGEYFLAGERPAMAISYFEKNVFEEGGDPLSNFYLSRIYFADKKYSEAYSYALGAMKQDSMLALYQQYEAARIAAQSFFFLGETNKFLSYTNKCLNLLPGKQDAYLDLIGYFANQLADRRVEKLFRQMLLENSYQFRGFEALEKHALKTGNYDFAEDLLETLLERFEYSDEALGHIYRCRGDLASQQGNAGEARRFWDISRNYYYRFLPEDDPVFRQIGQLDRLN
ncbi:MAG: hypothetical protein KDI06_06565 [Calditrichaeota bacterium]|nr:hypothetical protein [Calditrichota bacterium]HQU71143.1 hypothetical protein [Calditrichia bacterium]